MNDVISTAEMIVILFLLAEMAETIATHFAVTTTAAIFLAAMTETIAVQFLAATAETIVIHIIKTAEIEPASETTIIASTTVKTTNEATLEVLTKAENCEMRMVALMTT